MKKKKRFTVVLIAVLAFAALCITACASKKNNAAAVPESFSVSRSTEAYIDEFNIADYSVSVRYSDGTEKTYSLADYIAQADLDLLATLGSHDITVNLGGYSATITFTIKNHAFDGVTFPSGTVEYDGKSHSLAVAGLPAGANVTYANNGKTEPGTYNVTATLTRENYATKTLNATLVIEKRELAVDITGETLIKYDGEEHKNYKVTATNLVDSNDKVDLTLSYSGNMKDAGTYTVTANLAEHEHYKLTGNNTLTVTITREIHTVTFRQSGQPDRTVEVADLGAVAEEDIPRPVQEAGYTVTWNADALAGLSSVTDDIVVEATKTPIQYNITYEVGEGTNNPGNPETYTVEDQLFTLLEPTPKRGSFGGWYTADNAGGVRKTTIGGGETGDITLYAHWLEYYITAADGFTIDGTNLYIDVHNTVANLDLQDKIHVSAHCTWKLYKDFEGNSELTLKAISLNYGHNEAYVIVYSDESEYFTRYTLDIYRLSMREYKFTDRGTNKSSGTLEERSTVDKIADPAARTGYKFAGWAIKGSSDIVEFPYTVNKNVEFVAQWIVNTYTVHLNAAGGEGANVTDKTMTYDSEYTLPTLTRTGYTFLGWYAGETQLTEADGQSKEPWTIDEDNMQITAKWQANKYHLTVETNNSNMGTVSGSGDFDYGTEVKITATAPTALGYIFSGWYKDGERKSLDLEYTFTKGLDETYTAQYDIAPEMSNFVFISDRTTCTITGIKDTTVQDIVVPDYVTSIDRGAFSGCSNLTSITLPFVGDKPNLRKGTYQYPFGYIFGMIEFSGGTRTTQYYYGSSTSSTTYNYYYIPTSLTTVTITGSSYIPCGAFYGCSDLTEITIPASVTSIGDSAFYGCSKLTEITIPTSVTSIGVSAFSGCTDLQTVTLAGDSKLQSIGDSAFYGCSNLTEITIPTSVTSIGVSAFSGCTDLQTVTVAGDSKLKSIGGYAFYNCSNLTEITIPAGVTSIGNSAFSGCTGLQTVNWNATNCTKAGSTSNGNIYAIFDGCTLLTTVNMGENVETIPAYAFYKCSNLTEITIPASVTSIGAYAFYGCKSLTSSITIPASVPSIGAYAFYGCANLQTVTFAGDSKLESIGNYAFEGCSKLTEITIPASVTSIGSWAFYNCTNLNTVNWNATNCTKAGDDYGVYPIFGDCTSLTTVNIGENVETIPAYAFYKCKCTNLQTVTFTGDSKLKSIGKCAFEDCSSLTEITIPQGVTSIGGSAFSGCTNLQTVTFAGDSKLESIGNYAFSDCSSLTEITIPTSVTSIGESAFSGCSGLTKVNYLGDLVAWCNIDFGNTSANPLSCAHNLYINDVLQEEITIPQEITEIKKYAFYGCRSITSVTIHEGVTSIGNYAFYYCTNLQTVTFSGESKLKSIGDYAFDYCSGLTEITIPASVTSIGRNAFANCSNLTSITIPASVTSIGAYAFSGCSSLTKATFEKNTSWKVSTSSSMSSPTTLSSSSLQNSTTAAKYLRETRSNGGYSDCYWQRS